MPGRGGEAYHGRAPITGNPYTTLANPTKLGFTHEIYYAWATSWFKLRSIIAWSGFVWIIRLGIIISIVAIFKDRDVHPGHSYYFCSEINQCWYSRLPHLLLFVGITKEIAWISASLCDSELSWILKLLNNINSPENDLPDPNDYDYQYCLPGPRMICPIPMIMIISISCSAREWSARSQWLWLPARAEKDLPDPNDYD